MNIVKYLVCLALAGFISSCSPKQPEQQPIKLPEKKSQGVLTDRQQQTLDKAKQVEDVVNKAATDRLKNVDEASDEKQ